MLNQPMTSSSHWRIPKVEAALRDRHSAQRAQDWRQTLSSSIASHVRTGVQARTAARAASAASYALFASVLVGGVLVAPLLAVVALVALVAPPLMTLRHVAPALIVVSLLWLGVSIFGAHTPVGCHAESREAVGEARPVTRDRD